MRRNACKALLVFCLLLCIDRAWVLDYPHEQVVSSRFFSGTKGAAFCQTETQHATFRACLDEGTEVGLRRTALFGQVLSFGIKTGQAAAPLDDYTSPPPAYGAPGWLFTAVLFATALAGAWPGAVGRRQVDCAMTGSIIAVILLWLLAAF